MKINRRQFVGWMSIGAIITSFLSATSQAASDSEENTSSDNFQVVGTLDELEAEGSLTDDVAGVIVVLNKSNQLIALDLACPHRGCDVALHEGGERLACPCHGSQFTIRGNVLQGPARTNLNTYEVKTEDNQVLVKVG
ncbi:Rieske (2Fe-2S) protein [Euhalothece natronophila Z-M001]|uniref:Rieske (2Fe-2S) protein n=1 Tax=Euhalothece natronophila Z-M001 TaxID=522448 RepID=A0A5B8NPP1_9CHRO|nr:Rieske (2Fe-2S) protein [Euhalothece natronophila]QDZ40936.1 Rieske (2Fe-2S) protein [Euhalothece natronophila Z-M001]